MRTLCLLLCVCALGTAQTRSVTDNVYSAGQAGGGQDIHQSQCSSCHGKALDGGGGPPLVQDGFLSSWSERPLTNVVDKIQKTMPFNKSGSLSRQQSIDLAAYARRVDRSRWIVPTGRSTFPISWKSGSLRTEHRKPKTPTPSSISGRN